MNALSLALGENQKANAGHEPIPCQGIKELQDCDFYPTFSYKDHPKPARR
jgi:hypothetical protein